MFTPITRAFSGKRKVLITFPNPEFRYVATFLDRDEYGILVRVHEVFDQYGRHLDKRSSEGEDVYLFNNAMLSVTFLNDKSVIRQEDDD